MEAPGPVSRSRTAGWDEPALTPSGRVCAGYFL
jgi:hypothetical protein